MTSVYGKCEECESEGVLIEHEGEKFCPACLQMILLEENLLCPTCLENIYNKKIKME